MKLTTAAHVDSTSCHTVSHTFKVAVRQHVTVQLWTSLNKVLEELSEEDRQKKEELELLVQRAQELLAVFRFHIQPQIIPISSELRRTQEALSGVHVSWSPAAFGYDKINKTRREIGYLRKVRKPTTHGIVGVTWALYGLYYVHRQSQGKLVWNTHSCLGQNVAAVFETAAMLEGALATNLK